MHPFLEKNLKKKSGKKSWRIRDPRARSKGMPTNKNGIKSGDLTYCTTVCIIEVATNCRYFSEVQMNLPEHKM